MRWLFLDKIDGPISNKPLFPRRWKRGQVGTWSGITKDEQGGPFQFENGHKINSQTYWKILEDTLHVSEECLGAVSAAQNADSDQNYTGTTGLWLLIKKKVAILITEMFICKLGACVFVIVT